MAAPTAAAAAAAVRVEGLRVALGGAAVLRGCSLAVPAGALWMLLGPNGCGKRAPAASEAAPQSLAGLLQPDGGSLFVDGPRSFVFQNPDHQVVMPTVGADVAFGLGRLGLSEEEARERVKAALAAVGMADYIQRPVQTLSGGQKQRVAIAGALAEQSRVGVLEAVRAVVKDGQANGRPVTALWVTHRLEELAFADGAAYLEDGRVVVFGPVEVIEDHIRQRQDEAARQDWLP
eukprot:SM000094S24727  [mRNA]  locus=s94:437407:439221:+ [translate_table: standard]